MNTNTVRDLASRILLVVGGIGMLAGAVDPLEGSIVILAGSLLMALGTFLGPKEHRLLAFRIWVFMLIAIGVSALWGLSMVGGIGGKSGHSMWWGLLILPYLIGWSLGLWGPGSPRWLSVGGIVVGLWYLILMAMVVRHASRPGGAWPGIIMAIVGVVTIGGCLSRLLRRIPRQP